MSETFIVSAEARCVQGHFPGAPIVPGAYLLGRVHQSFRRHYGDSRLASLKKIKFIAPIVPGEAVSIGWDDSRWPALKVVLSVDGQVRLQASARAD